MLGATGLVAGWDYDAGISRAENRATDKFVHGYVLYDQFVAGVDNGTINPFGPSSQAGRDLINSIEVNDSARRSRGVTEAVDAKFSRALTALAGGDLQIAIGGEFRRETEAFTPSALLTSNNIAGDRDSGALAGSSTALVATSDSRKVAALYTELSAPVSKQLELQLAARYDRYSAIGGTTNPKVGLRWQPSKSVLVRASANTGFRAPSLDDLHRPTTYGTTASLLTDPECVASGGSIDGCTDQWPVERRSNAALKPERSRQFSLGTVVEPMHDLTFSLDYWNIQVRDVISTLGEQIIIGSPSKYDGSYISRDEDGFITNILLHKENQGRLKTSGLDIGAQFAGVNTPAGRFSGSVNGTLVLQYQRQFGPLEPYRSNLGVFLNDQVIQRWRHRLNLDWDWQDLGLTLSNSYSSSYADQNSAYDPVSNQPLESRRVHAYSLWDLAARWNATKSATLRAGVQNLFKHGSAVLEPVVLLPGDLRPDLHGPPRPHRLRGAGIQVPLSARPASRRCPGMAGDANPIRAGAVGMARSFLYGVLMRILVPVCLRMALAALCIVANVGVHAACLTSETEPNNTDTNANAGVCSGTPISGSLSSSGDYDWYRLDVTGPGTINISLSHGSSVDFDWYLYAATGSYIAYASTTNNPETGQQGSPCSRRVLRSRQELQRFRRLHAERHRAVRRGRRWGRRTASPGVRPVQRAGQERRRRAICVDAAHQHQQRRVQLHQQRRERGDNLGEHGHGHRQWVRRHPPPTKPPTHRTRPAAPARHSR